MENIKALFIIVNAGFAEEIVDIARLQGAGGATIINARSGGKSQKIMGITIDSEKEMVISIVSAAVAVKIMEAVKEKAGVGSPAHSVCFVMPVEKMTETISNNDENQ